MSLHRPVLRAALAVRSAPRRGLHMTGAATYASKLLTSADGKSVASPAKPPREPMSYPFNTSRSLKTVGDSSTIDFAFLPDVSAVESPQSQQHQNQEPQQVNFTSDPETDPSGEQQTIRPQIYTVAADGDHISSHSAISPVLPADQDVDLGSSNPNQADTVTSTSKSAQGADGSESMFRQVWSGFLDDAFGPKTGHSPAH